MFARCLVHGSVAPTFRRGSRDRSLAVPYRRSVRARHRRRDEKKGAKETAEGEYRRPVEDEKEIPGRVFSTILASCGKNPDASLLLCVRARTTDGERERKRKRKAIKARALSPRTPFFPAPLRPSDFGDQISKPYYLNFFTRPFLPRITPRPICFLSPPRM